MCDIGISVFVFLRDIYIYYNYIHVNVMFMKFLFLYFLYHNFETFLVPILTVPKGDDWLKKTHHCKTNIYIYRSSQNLKYLLLPIGTECELYLPDVFSE